MKNETKGKFPSPNSPYFEINKDAFPFGAALHASLAARYLLDIQSETPVLNADYHNNCKVPVYSNIWIQNCSKHL